MYWPGLAIHVLWVVAAVLFVLWLVGLIIGRGRKRWYSQVLSLVDLDRSVLDPRS